jgi:uncharacterized membrane protein
MTRDQFIARLRSGLAGMSPEAIDDIVSDYEAHFVEGLANGRTEDQVAEALGDPDRLARDLRAAAPATPWEAPKGGYGREWRFGGGRAFARFASYGVMGWIGLAIAIVVAILVFHVVIAVVGAILVFVLPVVLIVALIAVLVSIFSGGFWFHRGHWNSVRRSFDGPVYAAGAQTSRSFSWTGGDTLRISLPADVAYTQSSTVALSISGPGDALDHVLVERGEIRYDRWVSNAGRLRIVLSAPDITAFQVAGMADMTIAEYRQDRMKIRIAGKGAVKAAGAARSVNVGIAGKGDVDLGAITGESVKVEIAGSGTAVIAPTEIAEVGIAGSGLVTLLTNPPVVRTRIAGSGKIVHAQSAG